MKKLLTLIALLPCSSFAQDMATVYGKYVSTVDTVVVNGRIVTKGSKIAFKDGDSAVLRKIEMRGYGADVYPFGITKGGRYVPLDERAKDATDKRHPEPGTYTASNGITYKVGDTVMLGRGSAPNGNFRYLNIGGWGAALVATSNDGNNSSAYDVGRGYSGLSVKIKKIVRSKWRGTEKVIFVVGGGNITNYNLYIEDAIATCEVKDCKSPVQATTIIQQPLSTADELAKFKKLLDQGAITQEEYDAQKKKLLGN